MSELIASMTNLEENEVLTIVRQRVELGDDPMSLLEECRAGMAVVGDLFQKREYFLGELMMCGEIFKQAMAIIEPRLTGKARTTTIGRMVLGTVKGDIHNIGKDFVAGLLRIHGFEVFDLGTDVEPELFADKAAETGAPIVGMSGLITPSFEWMKETVKAIERRNLRDKVRVIIGGGITIKQVQDYVGADAFTRDAAEGVEICKRFLEEVKR